VLDNLNEKPKSGRRVIWIVAILAVAAVLAIVFEPSQTVMGKLAGDAFFQSHPTRYWVTALQSGPTRQADALSQLQQGGKPAVPVLIGILGNTSLDATLRCTAAEILAKLGPDAVDAGPVMIASLRDADSHVQALCVAGLPKVSVPAATAVPLLTDMLKSSHTVVCARALSTYRGAAAPSLPILIELLQDHARSPEIRANAARTIGKIGPASISAVPALIGEMGDADAAVREHCAEALGDIGPEAAAEGLPALIKVLTDVNTRVRRDAVRSLGHFGDAGRPAVADIRKLLKDPEKMVREAAGNALKAVAPDEAIPADEAGSPEKAKDKPAKAVNGPK
jgi:HEAT repeat protein